jgi:hypothetical protein
MKAACFTKMVGVYGAAHQDAQRKNLLDGSLESFKGSETYQSKVPKSNLGG